MYLVFQTTEGEITLDSTQILGFRENRAEERTEIWLIGQSMYEAPLWVLESAEAIRKALAGHYCVERVVQPTENTPITSIKVRTPDGEELASWETSEDGHHTPT